MVTSGIALAGAAYGALLVLLGSAACPDPATDSEYGSLSWSLLPPGPRCTWTRSANGFDRVDGPTPVMSVWLLVLVGLTVVLVRLRSDAQR